MITPPHAGSTLVISLAGMACAVLPQQPATAATATRGNVTLEEVTVTASKRGEESTQSIPSAIQAISGSQLATRGATEFADYVGQVPSLSFNDLGPGDKKYVIRGITSTGPATVGVYYDEAVITASNANDGGGRNADIRLFDLERIEVLKGPQGTLYGASSMSGTIRYITRKPVLDAVEGYIQTEVSDTARSGSVNYNANGAINLPVVDNKLALRITGWHVHNAGFIDDVRIPAGTVRDANDETTQGGRLTLRWQPVQSLNILATTTTQSTHSGGSSRYTPAGAQSFGDAAAGFPPVPGGDLINTDLALSPWDEKLKVYGLTAEYTHAAGIFTATSNYFDRHIDYAFDSSPILFFFGVPFSAVTLQPQERRIVSSELRYASTFGGPVNFVAGAFHQDEKSDFAVNVVKTNALGRPSGPFSPLDSDDALQNPEGNTFFGRTDINDLEQYAVFGEVTFALSDKLSLLAGVRYFHSEQDSAQETTHPFGGFGPNIPEGIQTNTATGEKTTFKLNLSYLTGFGLVYATVSEGFRVGGTNAANLPFASGIPPSYGPDKLRNYEIGAKSEFLEQRLRLNAAAYAIRWEDIQIQAIDATGAFPFTTNAGTASVDGVELEANVLFAPGLQLDFGGSYQEAKLTEDQPLIPNNPNLGQDGDLLPKVPKLQFSAALTYSFPLGESDMSLRAEVNYRDSTNTQYNTASPFNVPLDSYEIVNLRANLDWNDWTLSAFAKNVFDERAQIDAIASDQDPLARITTRPRTIGVAVTRQF